MFSSEHCACGCKKFPREGKVWVHGHHAKGRKKTDEEKAKIGAKNSENMRRFFEENPDRMKAQVQFMRSGITEESEQRRFQACKESWREDEERRTANAQRIKERWKDGEMEGPKQKAIQTLREGYASGRLTVSEERRDAISRAVSQRYLEGGFQWSRGKYISRKTGQESYYRSSWELRWMEYLDVDPDVYSWEHEPFVIEYEWKGERHRYLPDFIVTFGDGRREIQEIGVKTLKTDDRNLLKQAAARDWCQRHPGSSFRLVTDFQESPQT